LRQLLAALSIQVRIRLVAISNAIHTMLTYVMPVCYPLALLPEYLQLLAHISPLVKSIIVNSTEKLLFHTAILLAILLLLTALIISRGRWRE
jgi:ABC-type polysaccharide/polyol phosphate export permease